MEKNIKVSICIPVYPMKNGKEFLERCLDSIIEQSFEDFEVVISDNSDDDILYKVACKYGMPISYAKHEIHGASANTNAAIKRARGEIIKILHMDDYFAHKDALKRIVEAFKGGWLATGCSHTKDGKKLINSRFATYNDKIHTGNNTIGSPSVIAFENNNPLLFDTSLVWLFDCDLYKRLHARYGKPTIVNDFNVVIGIGEHQMTELIEDSVKIDEEKIIKSKYV